MEATQQQINADQDRIATLERKLEALQAQKFRILTALFHKIDNPPKWDDIDEIERRTGEINWRARQFLPSTDLMLSLTQQLIDARKQVIRVCGRAAGTIRELRPNDDGKYEALACDFLGQADEARVLVAAVESKL